MATDTDTTRRSPGAEAIAAERARQIDVEGWTPEHDAGHYGGEMMAAAHCYLDAALRAHTPFIGQDDAPEDWPWEPQAWKPSEDPVANLVKAGALIAAELDRLSGRHDA